MISKWGQFTAMGGPEVESAITEIVAAVADALDHRLTFGRYIALALMGGYGRGEGGVEIVNGVERPHNNLDFLLVLTSGALGDCAIVKHKLDAPIQEISAAHGIGIDLVVVTAAQLQQSESLVIWYDMRFGHKTILGSDDFIQSLSHFSVEKIPASDVRNLLVNRGTLCLINDELLEKGDLTIDERRAIVKHGMKAIIGYGDALLYFLGIYHWSYTEKRKRMRARIDIPESFKSLYAEAIAFRFQPQYDEYLQRDLGEWMGWLYSQLESVHLLCETRRLGRVALAWSDYIDAALKHILIEDLTTPRGLVKKARNLIKPGPFAKNAPMLARLGCLSGGMRNVLPIVFPTIAYAEAGDAERERAMTLLGAADSSVPSLRRAYLKAWGTYGDTNFHNVLNKLEISLTPVGAAS